MPNYAAKWSKVRYRVAAGVLTFFHSCPMAVVQMTPYHNQWLVLLLVAQVPDFYPAEVPKQAGAVIDSFMSHSPGVFSGTFSGTYIYIWGTQQKALEIIMIIHQKVIEGFLASDGSSIDGRHRLQLTCHVRP